MYILAKDESKIKNWVTTPALSRVYLAEDKNKKKWDMKITEP